MSSASVDKLFSSPVLVRLLRFLLINSAGEFTIDELARRIKSNKESVKKQIALLKKMDIVNQIGKSKAARYKLNIQNKYVFGLYELLVVASSSRDEDILDNIAKATKNLSLVVLTGLFTDNKYAETDILIVSEKANDKKIKQTIEEIENDIARELRYVILKKQDFNIRYSMQDRLLKNIFDYPHKILFNKDITLF